MTQNSEKGLNCKVAVQKVESENLTYALAWFSKGLIDMDAVMQRCWVTDDLRVQQVLIIPLNNAINLLKK